MSEQQLSRLDSRLDRVEGRIDRMADDIAVLQTDVGVLKTDVKDLKIGQARLEDRLEEVHQRMGVMHEDLVDKIKALGGDDGTRLEMRRTVGEVRREFAEHATLDDDAHRFFANSLKDHDRRLGTLESRKKR